MMYQNICRFFLIITFPLTLIAAIFTWLSMRGIWEEADMGEELTYWRVLQIIWEDVGK